MCLTVPRKYQLEGRCRVHESVYVLPAADFHRASKRKRCSTITTATIIGGTLRRPTSENRSVNISSGKS